MLTLILGPMFSGKSSEVLRHIRRWQSVGKRVVVVNHVSDVRYGRGAIVTHDGCDITAVCATRLSEAAAALEGAEVVVVDEAQFFPDLLEVVAAASDGPAMWIVAGLSGDSRRERFGQVLDLVPIADEIIHQTALCSVCRDGTPAPFTLRIPEAAAAGQVLVGAADVYRPVCRAHWRK